jgi:hypothetical protein
MSGWMQQGVESFFATQRILLDLAMRQNVGVMHVLRERLADPQHSPTTIVTEMTGEGMTNFIEAQKVLLTLAQEQNNILMNGVKERFGAVPAAGAMTDMLRRSLDTFIQMQQDFLKIANKQAHTWLESAKAGKPYKAEAMADLAREAMENFVGAQKKFLDVIADETAKATSGKALTAGAKKMKQTELNALARKATESFVEAQKKLFDVAGQQMNANVKVATRAMKLMTPLPLVPFADLTREGVKSYVDAQKALVDVMLHPHNGRKHEPAATRHAKRAPAQKAKAHAATA